MRKIALDNRPDIEITRDCPVARRILAINLFICSVIMALMAWYAYQKIASPKPLAGFIFFTVINIRGAIWYVRSVPRRFNSDLNIIIYAMTFCTTLAIIKWVVFWYCDIDTRKLPSVYEKWDNIFDLVSIAIAGAAAGLPDIIKQRERQKHTDKSSE